MDEIDETRPAREASELSRRQLIRRGAVVGGAAIWVPPVIQSLRLPAHAQTGSPAPELRDCGWMTGGGNVRTAQGVRATYGFELHCQIPGFPPNNFELHWRIGRTNWNFNLETLASSVCVETAADQGPNANFDTLTGSGTGTLTTGGVSQAATATFLLRDAGNGNGGTGPYDYIDLVIRNAADQVVLEVHGNPDGGTLEAHSAFGRRNC